MAKTFEVKGFEELLKGLDEIPKEAQPIMKGKMEDSLLSVRGTLREYPPQPSRTRAKSFNTYVRGRGHYPRSAFAGGQFNSRAGGRALRRGQAKLTSERLGTKWTHEVEFDDAAVTGVIGNTASYSNVVQGNEDDQNYWHGVTGWVTLDDSLDQHEEEIYKNFEAGVIELLEVISRK
ncbi:MAG: hypothetical protein KDJ52_00210 [Anaerolineae bacterium]|nr:hypothetical protein [Anaerolineae bacterium]